MTLPLVLLGLSFVPMAFEWTRSRANERALRAAGAREPQGDVYRLMQLAYPTGFVAMALEAWLRRSRFTAVFAAGAAIFVGAKALKYWAIASLGPRWTFRVLVPPGSARVASGPYRHMRHPNYAAVAGEMVGMAVMAQAPIAGSAAVLTCSALMLLRIGVEERALGKS